MNPTDFAAAQLVSPESPWLGLRPFSEDARAYFFGRSAELQDLFERIVDKPLCVLFGQSGLGKSSLLQAGLVPRLREQGFLPVLIRFIHDPDAPALEVQFLDRLRAELAAAGFASQAATVDALKEKVAGNASLPLHLWLLFHDPACGFLADRNHSERDVPRPVFLIDQFEEIFTLGERAARRSEAASFRETLTALVENRPPGALAALLEADESLADRLDYKVRPLRVLLSLREDFLHLLERWRRAIPSLMENRVELRMLNGVQALEAVLMPGRLRNARDQAAIVPEDVGGAIVRFVAGAEEGVPLQEIDAVPPLLSLVCAELNSQRLSAGVSQITQSQFQGRSSDILSSFYGRSFELGTYTGRLPKDRSLAAVLDELRRIIEDRLLSADGFRESVAFDTVLRDLSRKTSTESAATILNLIVDRRLLTVEERGGVRRVELAHDVLTRIVRTSRDERHEAEKLQREREEREQAQRETLRITRERNRLRRFAAVAVALAIIAIAGAIAGWLGQVRALRAESEALAAAHNEAMLRGESEQARQDAEAAEARAIDAANAATQGFESAFAGLSLLWDKYASTNLENVRGISWRQSRQLKGELRDYLLPQLIQLHKEQPNHQPTIRYVVRLLLDEGFAANLVDDLPGASMAMQQALEWNARLNERTVQDEEALAELLLESARNTNNSGNRAKALEESAEYVPRLRELIAKHPESWRLKYLLVRLENVMLPDVPAEGAYAALADQLAAIMDASNNDVDVLLWYVQLQLNELGGDEDLFAPKEHNYDRLQTTLVEFRERIIENRKVSIAALEESMFRFQYSITILSKHLNAYGEKVDGVRFRSLLKEADASISSLEIRLPRSTEVYPARGALLRLQKSALPLGLNTMDEQDIDELLAQYEITAARLGVAATIQERLGPAFRDYVAAIHLEERAEQLALIRSALRDFASLNVSGASEVLGDQMILDAVEKLRTAGVSDPLLSFHGQLLEIYVQLYAASSRTERASSLNAFSRATSTLLDQWNKAEKHAQIVHFWDDCYRGLPLEQFTAGEKDSFIITIRIIVVSLVKVGRVDEAKVLVRQGVAICQTILQERPWDYWLKDSYGGLCFFSAEAFTKDHPDSEIAQELLRLGWGVFAQKYDKQEIVDKYPVLGLKGEAPPGASEEDAVFFQSFGPNAKSGGMKRFTVPVDFSGTKYPFNVYVRDGKSGYDELMDQFRWVKEYRGGVVAPEVRDSFTRLYNIAVENNVSFMDLCVYALGTADAGEDPFKSSEEEFEKAKKEALAPPEDGSSVDQAVVDRKLRAAYEKVMKSAASSNNWDKYLDYSRERLKAFPTDVYAQSAVAVGLFHAKRAAHAIYDLRALWDAEDGKLRTFVSETINTLPEGNELTKGLKRLHGIALENNVSFPDLTYYAVYNDEQTSRTQILKLAESHLSLVETSYASNPSPEVAGNLALAANSASDAALMAREWEKANGYARRTLELGADADLKISARANAATAALFLGRYDEALAEYRNLAGSKLLGREFLTVVEEDFTRLEAGGFYHPDMDRMRTALGIKPK